MTQSMSIIVFLFIGFVVYITIKKELPDYKKAIFGMAITEGA